MFLRQSTVQTVRFGAFVDSTDGDTAETALTIAQADMQLSKDGGVYAQKNAAGNATHDTDGWYSTSLNATDVNTVGELILKVHVAGALSVNFRWWVIEEAIYDAIYGAAATGFNASGRVDVGEWVGVAPNALISGRVDANAQAGIAPLGTAMRGTDGVDTASMRGTDNAALASVLGALADAAAAGDPTSADTVMQYLKQLINTLEGAVGIPTYPVGADPINGVSIAEAIRAIRDDVTGLSGAVMRGTDGVDTSAMRGTDGANTVVPPTEAQMNARTLVAGSYGTAANQTSLLNRLGDFAGSGLNTIKGFLQALFRSDGGVSGANIPSEINEVENTIAGTYDPTTDSVEAIRNTAPLGTAMRGTDGVDTAVMRGTDGANTTTPPTVAAIRTEMDTNSTQLGAIVGDTNELQTDWADGGRLDLLIDSIIAEVVTAAGEPAQGAPPVSASIGVKITYLYKAWRNRSNQTATRYQLYGDDAVTVDHAATVSDDLTTGEKGEVVTGP